MFNCSDCNYTSNRKSNLLSHTTRKHFRDLKLDEHINTKPLKIEVVPVIEVEKVIEVVVPVIEVVEVHVFKCTKCTKILKSKQSLNYHINICKEVLNPLECHLCHKVLSSKSSKSQHIKTCKEKKEKEEKKKKEEEEIRKKEEEEIKKTKRKKTIPRILRINVWNEWIGEDLGTSTCLCCKKIKISQMNFDCGHIVSEYDGGKAILENLRPICRICNSSMQTENMNEFMERLKL